MPTDPWGFKSHRHRQISTRSAPLFVRLICVREQYWEQIAAVFVPIPFPQMVRRAFVPPTPACEIRGILRISASRGMAGAPTYRGQVAHRSQTAVCTRLRAVGFMRRGSLQGGVTVRAVRGASRHELRVIAETALRGAHWR